MAETNNQQPVDFIHLTTAVDYYTRQPHGHIAALVVAPTASGRGLGQALLGAVETGGRQQHYTWLTLTAFAQNQQAIQLYEQMGYGPDIIKYVKELS